MSLQPWSEADYWRRRATMIDREVEHMQMMCLADRRATHDQAIGLNEHPIGMRPARLLNDESDLRIIATKNVDADFVRVLKRLDDTVQHVNSCHFRRPP